LVLLHGIGMSHRAWNAVTPHLTPTRRVIAFDIAGFGMTPPLPSATPPTIAHLVDGLEQSLQQMGFDVPVDIAGNSLGGYMALEAAKRAIARSVVAISPPGLWKAHPSPRVKYVLSSMRFMAKNLPAFTRATMRNALLRELILAVPISLGSWRMPASDAVDALHDLETSPAFEETFEHTRAPFTGGRHIAIPITVAFGDRDWLLTKGSRRRNELPSHTRWIEKPGWGHVPMWVDPVGVSQLIMDGTQ
jgi:pimeloyl-ACP methyl ester carboxylesterase